MRWISPLHRSVVREVLLGLLLFLVALVSTAAAQVGNVTLQGTVKDPTAAAIPGATVTATNTQTGLQKVASCDGEGHFAILNLVPGFYDVQASQQGFATAVQLNRQLLVGTTVTQDFTLQVSAVSQVVEVTASAQTIDITQSQVAKVIEPTTIDNLPTITRSFSDLAALSAGVIQGPPPGAANSGQSIQIGGGTSYETGIVMDGTPVANLRFGGSYANFAQDWIQEFALVSQLPAAEFGGASAGVVNAVTRSGTNAIKGRVYGYFQNSALNATPSLATSKADSSVRRIGGMVGGPIKKDKLFYFLGYENFYTDQSVTVSVPAAFVDPSLGIISGEFPQISKSQITMTKLDYTVNTKHTLWARWNYEWDDNTNTQISRTRPVGAAGFNKGPTDLYAAAWDWTVSPTTLNEVRANYNWTNLVRGPNCINYLGTYPGFPSQPGSTVAGNPIGYWGTLTYPQAGGLTTRCAIGKGFQVTYDTHFDETITHSSGHHQLKFGGGARRYGFITPPFYRSATSDPQATINGTAPFTFDLATAVPPTLLANGSISSAAPGTLPVAYLARNMTKRDFDLPSWAFGWFAQDSWKATPNLTLNLGLRYDIDRSGSGVNKYVPADNPKVHDNYLLIAPRFGFAWTPLADKKTVIRGGMGMFYDKTELNVFLAYIGDTPGVQAYRLTASRPSQNPYCFGNSLCSSGVVPGNLQRYVQFELAKAVVNFTVPSFPAPGTTDTITIGGTTLTIPAPTFLGPGGTLVAAPIGTTNPIDADFTHPGTLQVSGGVARQLSDRLNASADFVYNRGFNQVVLTNININPATLQPPIDPRYTTVEKFGNGGSYKHYSLRIQSLYRSRRGDSVNLAYSLGWAYDNSFPTAQFTVGTGSASTNPFDLNVDYGPALFDARHILNVAGTAHVRWGIQLSPIFSFVSALPYTATTSAAIVAGCPSYYGQCYPPGYTKGSLRGADTIALATRLSKQINLGEKRSVRLLAEAYNLLNRANFTGFGTNVAAANFQKAIAAGARRQLQFGLRFDF